MKSRILAAVSVLLFTVQVHATQIVQTAPYSGVLDIADSFTFDYFDTLGGTRVLDSVQLKITMEALSGGFIADNDSAQTANINYEYSILGSLSSSDVFISSSVGAKITDTVPLVLAADNGDGTGVIDSSGPDGALIDLTGESDFFQSLLTSSFGTFIGTGTYEIDLNTSRTFNISGGSGVEGGFSNIAVEGDIEVTYNYHVIPEPATLSMLTLGGLSLLARHRKRAGSVKAF